MSSSSSASNTGDDRGAGGAASSASMAALKCLYSVAAVRVAARRTLPRPVFDFADGGAEDERTLRRNEQAFNEVAILPRPLNGATTRDLSLDLFGAKLAIPLGIAPTGLAGLFWPDGERAAARAAAAAGTFYCASHGSVCTLEDIAATGSSPRWMQVFVYTDRGFTREMVDRARASSYDALVLTIDNQMLGNRERDIRNGFAIPPRFGLAGTLAAATKAAWLLRMRTRLPKLTFGNYARPGGTATVGALAGRMAAMLDPGLSWADVDWLRTVWSGPLLLKGVLHPSEAAEAVARGIDGIIVSNHGGRQLDGAAASLDALTAVVAAVAGRHTGAYRWRHQARLRRRQGAGARRLVLSDRAAAVVGARGRRRGGGTPRARTLPQGDRPRHGTDGRAEPARPRAGLYFVRSGNGAAT